MLAYLSIIAEIRTCSTKAIDFLFNLNLLYMTMRTRAMGTMIKIIGAKSNTLFVKSIVACRTGTEEYYLMEQFGGKKLFKKKNHYVVDRCRAFPGPMEKLTGIFQQEVNAIEKCDIAILSNSGTAIRALGLFEVNSRIV